MSVSNLRWQEICETETASTIDGTLFCADVASARQSPIDDYYEYVEHLLTLGDEQALLDSETLGRLLMLGLVSGVETYLRSLIAELLRVCPISRDAVATQLIPFGSIDYYGAEGPEKGLFDGISLAGADEVRKASRKLLGVDLGNGGSINAALAEFDKLCHLRHAAVHARGSLGRGNAAGLGLTIGGSAPTLCLTLPTLHRAGIVCHSTVRAYNRFIFVETVHRWIGAGRLSGVWVNDEAVFKPLYFLFHSTRDGVGPGTAYNCFRSVASMAGLP